MKRLCMVLGALLATRLFAQEPARAGNDTSQRVRVAGAAEVPQELRERFGEERPGVAPVWTANGDRYSATYRDSLALGHILTFDARGQLLSTQDEQGRTGFPPAIERFQEEYYPNTPYTVWLYTDADGNRYYYITRERHTWWFDTRGEVMDRSKNKKVKGVRHTGGA